MIWNISKDNIIIIILVNNRISVVVMSGSSKISGIDWRSSTLLLFLLIGRAMFFNDADLFFPLVPALARLPSLAWVVFFVLLAGFSHPCNQNGTKCYDVVTRENIVLEYNMQVMCNWMWFIVVKCILWLLIMYSV